MDKKEFKKELKLFDDKAAENGGMINMGSLVNGFNYVILEHSGFIPKTLDFVSRQRSDMATAG